MYQASCLPQFAFEYLLGKNFRATKTRNDFLVLLQSLELLLEFLPLFLSISFCFEKILKTLNLFSEIFLKKKKNETKIN